MQYPILKLKPGRERSLVHRHPWVFSGAVQPTDAPDGALVALHTAEGNWVGYGHYAANHPITCRMLVFTQQPLLLEEGFWLARLRTAHAFRKTHLALTPQSAYRLVNAEGDYLPGLVVDVYADVAVVQLRTLGMQAQQELIAQYLTAELGLLHVLVKGEADGETGLKAPPNWLQGARETVEFVENGIQYTSNPVQGQKTGFFLDQRDNRRLLASMASSRTVLNAFGYSGAFSLAALQGGAKRAVSVDVSAAATALANTNAALNPTLASRQEALTADCFSYLRQLAKDEFDCIILDPPAFSKHIRTVDKAARGYKDINLQALSKLRAGGLLFTFSCSQHISKDLFRKIVYGAAVDAGRPVRLLYQLGQAVDHPVDIYHLEGEYLKGLLLEVGT